MIIAASSARAFSYAAGSLFHWKNDSVRPNDFLRFARFAQSLKDGQTLVVLDGVTECFEQCEAQ